MAIEIISEKPCDGLTLISTLTPLQAWKSRRRKKLVEAFDRTFCPRKTAYDWQDFVEAEFSKFQRGEIPASKYMRDKSQPGQPALIKPL